MTVGSQVKQNLASLKSIQASLQGLALKSVNEQSQQMYHETMIVTEEIIDDIKKRVGELEREEPQYKGF
ncbi:DUF1657 domain-containing protein [Litchfieldia salsa]|uniref:DUF1657 domain-containing protein n=1 Tax=Litchfieldia salsa TaxID=930152 RepID=A0A1H0W9X7_9BACI|nr:DUF1657 domain-containing protein [Litchfieldia salsa]SDP87552.1 Protein of unknown function [Litchfieldia salsa]